MLRTPGLPLAGLTKNLSLAFQPPGVAKNLYIYILLMAIASLTHGHAHTYQTHNEISAVHSRALFLLQQCSGSASACF